MGFNLKDYEEVKDRLPRFLEATWQTRPRVITRLVTNPDNLAAEAAFVAELWDGDVMLSTGYAFELRTDRGVNSTSHVENAETSAIGRALANYGFASGKNRPSREEMEKVERMTPDAEGVPAAESDEPKASDGQVKMIWAVSKTVGWEHDRLIAAIEDRFGEGAHPDTLTKSQARKIIDGLKTLEKAQKASRS